VCVCVCVCSRNVTPLILNLGTKMRLMVNFNPRPPHLWDRTPVHLAQEAAFAAEPSGCIREHKNSCRCRHSRRPSSPSLPKQWIMETPFMVVKRLRRDTNYSPPSSVQYKLKNSLSNASLHCTPSSSGA
jgi:hypothetical protein